MTSSETLLKYLAQLNLEKSLQLNGNSYTPAQLKLAEQMIKDLSQEIGHVNTKPKLSRRRAFIIILEELYFDISEYPKDLSLEGIHRKASQRFTYMNRDVKNFSSPMQVHPKNPCLYYEDHTHAKARYRSALKHLVLKSNRYFKVADAEASLEIIYNEILIC